MRHETNHTGDEMTTALAGMHAGSIPMFQRAVVTPDAELDAKMREELLWKSLAKLTKEEAQIVVSEITAKARERMSERERRILQFLQKVFAFALVPAPCAVKVMGMAYALDLGITMELPMAAMARRMGVTRASLSNAAWNYCRQNDLEPSRWMRGEESAKASRKAREKFCETNNEPKKSKV